MEYKIELIWDSDSAVWIAQSDDVPGIVLESGSFDALIERLRYAIPEIIELNGGKNDTVNICFVSERHEKVFV